MYDSRTDQNYFFLVASIARFTTKFVTKESLEQIEAQHGALNEWVNLRF